MITAKPQWPGGRPGKVPLMFISDYLRDDDLSERRALSGSVGRVFNGMLRTSGIARAEVLVTSLFDVELTEEEARAAMRDPEAREAAFKRLSEEIEIADPVVIVPLGNFPLQALTGEVNITRYRGSPLLAERLAPGRKLLPTYHPEQVMKQWKFYHVAVGDFETAEAEVKIGREIVYPEKWLLLNPTEQEAIDFCKRCLASPLVSTDIETGWGQITCIGFAPTPTEAMCIPFVDLRKPSRSYWTTPEQELRVLKAVREVLESPQCKLLGQNFMYDAAWLLEKWGVRSIGYEHDTRLIHANLYPELPKDLGFMASSYTKIGAYKHWSGRYSEDKRDD